jgi:hypothetical protein
VAVRRPCRCCGRRLPRRQFRILARRILIWPRRSPTDPRPGLCRLRSRVRFTSRSMRQWSSRPRNALRRRLWTKQRRNQPRHRQSSQCSSRRRCNHHPHRLPGRSLSTIACCVGSEGFSPPSGVRTRSLSSRTKARDLGSCLHRRRRPCRQRLRSPLSSG